MLFREMTMIQNNGFVAPLLQRVFHPSDFSEASHAAFAHALVAALMSKSKLTLLHVSGHRDEQWSEFPKVRETLERWNILPQHSERIDVTELGIDVQKVQMVHDDPVEAITTYLNEHGTDLIVLATDQHKSDMEWLNRSVATSIARKSEAMTLFIPKGAEGFVSLATGGISLINILIPVAATPSAQLTIHAAARLITGLGCDFGVVTLLHVGENDSMPQVTCPELVGWRWKRITRDGNVVDRITQVVGETHADLIVMATDGRNGILDTWSERLSERVLQEACCPLLTIPNDGFLAAVL